MITFTLCKCFIWTVTLLLNGTYIHHNEFEDTATELKETNNYYNASLKEKLLFFDGAFTESQLQDIPEQQFKVSPTHLSTNNPKTSTTLKKNNSYRSPFIPAPAMVTTSTLKFHSTSMSDPNLYLDIYSMALIQDQIYRHGHSGVLLTPLINTAKSLQDRYTNQIFGIISWIFTRSIFPEIIVLMMCLIYQHGSLIHKILWYIYKRLSERRIQKKSPSDLRRDAERRRQWGQKKKQEKNNRKQQELEKELWKENWESITD